MNIVKLSEGLRRKRTFALVMLTTLCSATLATADPVVRQATGASAADIQSAVDAFRADLGGANNLNAPGSQLTGRREINWDGGGAAANATSFPSPMLTFVNRGAVFESLGTGFRISGQPAPEFGDLNATYPNRFNVFSSPRLFAPIDSNAMAVNFVVPGSTDLVEATVTGFGAVFTDVDRAGSTHMTFFNRYGQVMYEAEVPAASGDESLSFVGVSFNAGELVGFVLITSGNAALGPDETGTRDVVAMDDFIYGEPVPYEGVWISPGSTDLLRQGAFDIVLSFEGAPGAPTGGRVLLDGADITGLFLACVAQTQQSRTTGTFVCAPPRGFLAPGQHTLQVEVTFANGARIRNAATWSIRNAVP